MKEFDVPYRFLNVTIAKMGISEVTTREASIDGSEYVTVYIFNVPSTTTSQHPTSYIP